MFHFAEPDEAGFGVTILTPGLTRSSQPLMSLGLPLRTTITTTDWVRMPLVGVDFQSSATSLASTSLLHVGLEREVDDVGLLAADHGAGLVAGGAVGLLERDVLAVGGLVEVGDDLLVGLLEDGEAHQVDRVGAGGGSARAAAAADRARAPTTAPADRGLPLDAHDVTRLCSRSLSRGERPY